MSTNLEHLNKHIAVLKSVIAASLTQNARLEVLDKMVDHIGHMPAFELGGPGNLENLTAFTSAANTEEVNIEKPIASLLKQYPNNVNYTIEVQYKHNKKGVFNHKYH